jgi:hypothetical protein
MKVKFTAKRISKGNFFWPDEITIDDNSVTIKSPYLFGGKSKSFPIGQISVAIDNPMVGYSDITLFSHGTHMRIHGFTVSDTKKIKRLIEEGKTGNGRDDFQRSTGSRKGESDEEWKARSRQQDEEYRAFLRQQGEKARAEILEFIEKIKKVLTRSLKYFYLFSELKEKKEMDEKNREIVKYKKMLLKYLTKIGEESQFDSIVDECRKAARREADEKIRVRRQETMDMIDRIVHEGFQNAKEEEGKFDFELLDNEKVEAENDDYLEQVRELTNAYDSLNAELLEDDDEVEENAIIVDCFIDSAVYGVGDIRFFRETSFPKGKTKNKYELEMVRFLDIICKLYDSTAYQKTIDGLENSKKVYPFGLDNRKVIAYLEDETNSRCDKMSKLIDVTDSFIDRIANDTEV